jgi:hypothetical protein
MRRETRPAFSLVELLATLAATALLMVAVLNIVTHLSRDAARARAAVPLPCERADRVVAMLRWDLSHARGVQQEAEPGRIVLCGYGGIDPVTRTPTYRPAQVRYRVVDSGGTPALVREQQYLDDARDPQPWSDLVSRAVSYVSITRATEGKPDVAKGAPAAAAAFAEPQDVPAAVRLLVRFPGREATDERVLVLR